MTERVYTLISKRGHMDFRIEFEQEVDGRWKVLRALLRIGWELDSQITTGSHRRLIRNGYPGFTWAFHDGEEIGPVMLARIARQTGLTPGDL